MQSNSRGSKDPLRNSTAEERERIQTALVCVPLLIFAVLRILTGCLKRVMCHINVAFIVVALPSDTTCSML